MKIDKDLATLRLKKHEDFWIGTPNNQKSVYLLFWYMFTNVIFSADGTLTSLDIDFEYMTSNYKVTQLVQISNILQNIRKAPQDSLAETS